MCIIVSENGAVTYRLLMSTRPHSDSKFASKFLNKYVKNFLLGYFYLLMFLKHVLNCLNLKIDFFSNFDFGFRRSCHKSVETPLFPRPSRPFPASANAEFSYFALPYYIYMRCLWGIEPCVPQPRHCQVHTPAPTVILVTNERE